MTGDVTEVASEVTYSTGNQVLVVGVEVVGTGSDDTYDYNQSTIKICINQTCVCCFKELYMWMWGGGGCRSMTRHVPIVMYFSGLNTQMHHSWGNLGILSPWDSVPWDIILHGLLSLWGFVPLGFCPPGLLSHLDFVPLGFCPPGILSSWVFVFLGFCPLGYCPFVQWDFVLEHPPPPQTPRFNWVNTRTISH